MNIPEENRICFNSDLRFKIEKDWNDVASNMSIEYGVYIVVKTEIKSAPYMVNITFQVMDHKFESLQELRKALDNKAFL